MFVPKNENHVTFEEALDRAGCGWYSYTLTALVGTIIISFSFIVYSTTIIIPASACDLETNTLQQGLLAGAPVLGAILGPMVWGYLADTRGRRKILLISLFLGAIFNALTSISVNWIMLMILQFVAAFMVSGQYPVSMTYLSESVPMAKRNLFVLLVSSLAYLAQGLMAVIAIPIMPLYIWHHMPSLGIYWNSWRTTLVVYSVPSVICVVWLYFMEESPKFVYVRGNEPGAIEILHKIHKCNNTKGVLKVESIIGSSSEVAMPSRKDQIVPLFKKPHVKNLLLVTTVLVLQLIGPFIVWLPTIANQFMRILETEMGHDLTLCGIIDLSLNTPSNSGGTCALNVNALLIVFFVGALQAVINILVSFVVNIFGRRDVVMVVVVVCGLSGIAVNLVPNAIGSAVLFLVQLMGFMSLGLYTAIAVALFPTQLRAMAVAIIITGSRIGTYASIQVLNYLLRNNCQLGFYIFCGLFISSAIFCSFLPNDRRVVPPARPQVEQPTEDSKDL